MFLNWLLCQCNACQSRLEHLDGRREDDHSRQIIPHPDGCRKEAIVECVDASNATQNLKLSLAVSVWDKV